MKITRKAITASERTERDTMLQKAINIQNRHWKDEAQPDTRSEEYKKFKKDCDYRGVDAESIWNEAYNVRKDLRKAEASKSMNRRKSINAAESYGWVVEDYEAWDAYEFACEYFGKEDLDDQIVTSLSSEELASSLAFIFRMNEFREWDERNDDSDDEDIEESRKLSGRKSIKSSKRNTRRPVKAARITTDFSNFKPWSGAVDTWNELEKWDKIDLLEQILDDTYYNEEAGEAVLSETELNDLLWFEPETVYEWVGLYYNDETGEVSDEPFDEEDEDENEDIEESTKVRGKKSVKANRKAKNRKPVKAAETISGDMFEQVFNESLSNLNDVFKGNMTFDATVGSVYGASHDRVYPGDGIDFLYNLRDLAAANEGQNIMDYISSYLSDPIYLAVIDDTIDEYIGENISGEDMNNIDPTVAPGFVDEWYNMFYDDCDRLATQVSDDICRYLTSFAMSVEDIDAEMLNYPDNDDMIEDDFLIWKIYK